MRGVRARLIALLAAPVLALGGAAGVITTAAAAPNDVIADYFVDGQLNGTYSVEDLRGALAFAQKRVGTGGQYSAFADIVSEAITRDLAGTSGGAAVAAELMQREIAVLGLARGRNDALARHWPGLLHEQAIDLADPRQLGSWLDSGILAAFFADQGQVLLINNAGTIEPSAALPFQCAHDVARAVMLNVGSALMLSARVATLVQARPGCTCRILHLSSGAGRHAYPGWSVYGASKAALDQHARAVAQDALPWLRICSLAPGVVDTDMQAMIRAAAPSDFPEVERFARRKHNGGLATPESVAAAIIRLLNTELSAGGRYDAVA